MLIYVYIYKSNILFHKLFVMCGKMFQINRIYLNSNRITKLNHMHFIMYTIYLYTIYQIIYYISLDTYVP